MLYDRPQDLGTTIEVTSSNRPIKVAYLVPHADSIENNLLLDAVFYESYTRWGGAYTLLVPTNPSGFLDPQYEPWLTQFDPDFIYSYVELDDSFVAKIDQLACPISVRSHQIRRDPKLEIDWRAFIPHHDHYFAPVASITTVLTPYQVFPRPEPQEHAEVTVVTAYDPHREDRFLRDNFGIAFHLMAATHPIPGLYRTLCMTRPDLPNHMNVGSERCFSNTEALNAIALNKAVPIAKFAMAHSEAIPRPEPREWANAFSLFVGNTVVDRIHFWNARHLAPHHATTPGTMIVRKEELNDAGFVKALGEYFNRNNFLGGGNGPYQVSLRSYSHTREELAEMQQQLTKDRNTWNNIYVPLTYNAAAIPANSDVERPRFSRANDRSTFKLTQNVNELVALPPAHFAYLPQRHRGIAKGQWMVELAIQRHNNLSKFSNVIDYWTLPRRRKVVRAFTRNLSKVSANRNLAILPTTDHFPFGEGNVNKEHKYSLRLPDDEEFFRYLALDFDEYPRDDLRKKRPSPGYQALGLSDKGQNLRGVISMFSGISDAYATLTKKFWRDIVRTDREGKARYLSFTMNDFQALMPNDLPTKRQIAERLRMDVGKVTKFLNANLLDALEYLIARNIFYLVHDWRCKYCGHINMRSFDQMKTKNQCEICSTDYFTPIDLDWSYQLSEFVYRSLAKNNGLTVLWVLGYLQDRLHSGSFWYLPEVDLYENYRSKEKNEIDALCVLDGKFCVIEAKRSCSLLVEQPEEVEKFIKVATLIDPDVAILAFERYTHEGDEAAIKERFKALMADIRARLPLKIELKTIIGSDIEEFNDVDLDMRGHRTSLLLNKEDS